MTLTKIEYGSIASSEIVNNNFQHLDDKISSVSQSLSANTTALSGTISSLSATVATNKETQAAQIDKINSTINEHIYVKESYKNGYDWYRLYSDGWIEQGGYCSLSSNGQIKINLLKPMEDTYYSILTSVHRSYSNGNWDIGISGACANDENSINISCGRDGSNIYWRVSGFANIEQQS